jgi:hypothetical protein
MKELLEIKRDDLHVGIEKYVKKEVKLISRITPKPGHTCFELNLKTGDVSIAEYDTLIVDQSKIVKGQVVTRRKLIAKANCIYISALNQKNAEKKFQQAFDKNPQSFESFAST